MRIPFWPQGYPDHQMFLRGVLAYLKAVRGTLVCNGTTGLLLTIRSVMQRRTVGEYVILPSFAHPATLQAVLWNNLIPIFADVNEQTWGLTEETIRAVAIDPRQVRCIVAVATFGFLPVLPDVLLVKDEQIPVVLDACQAFGSFSYAGEGSRQPTAYSFAPGKVYPQGGGGLVTYADEDEAFWQSATRWGGAFCGGLNAQITVALPSAFSIKAVEAEIAERLRLVALYDMQLGITAHRRFRWNGQFYPVRILEGTVDARRRILLTMHDAGIECRPYFSPALHHRLPGHGARLPVTEMLSRTMCCLPIYPGIAEPKQMVMMFRACVEEEGCRLSR